MRNDFYKFKDSEAETNKVSRIAKNHYIILFGHGVEEDDDNSVFVWRKDYDHMPSKAEAKTDIEALINGQTDNKILSGLRWRGNPVWLSSENQFNFKCAYDIAVQTNGENLPARYKLGQDGSGTPIYYTFEDLATFTDFYTSCAAWIYQCINEGWSEKDGVDYDAMFEGE